MVGVCAGGVLVVMSPSLAAAGGVAPLDRDRAGKEVRERGIVVPLVVFPAGLRDIERREIAVVVMMLAVPGPLEQAPKALNCVRMHRPVRIGLAVVDNRVLDVALDGAIGAELVGDQYGAERGYCGPDKGQYARPGEVTGHLCDYLATALHGANDRGFLRAAAARVGRIIIAAVALARPAADVGFVCFDNALQEDAALFRGHLRADTGLHVPGGFLVEAQVPGQLVGRQGFLGIDDERNGEEPLLGAGAWSG